MKENFTFTPPEAKGMSDEAERAKELMKGPKKEWQHFTPEYVEKQAEGISLSRIGRIIAENLGLYREQRIYREEARVRIETDKPITIFAISDVHYGNVQTDHRRFHREVRKIEETPNTYIVFGGNLIDNAVPSKHPDLMLENSIPPDQQVAVMRQIIKKLGLKGKVIGAVKAPEHEGWSWTATGQDVNVLIYGYEGRNFPVMENGGRIRLKVGKQTYNIALYHQTGPFESNFNPEHATRQMNRLRQNMEADIVIASHKHRGAVSQNYEGVGKRKKPAVYIRGGTYKGIGEVPDRYAQDRLGASGEPSGQSVTLFPDKKLMEPHLTFEGGIRAHLAHYLFSLIRGGVKR